MPLKRIQSGAANCSDVQIKHIWIATYIRGATIYRYTGKPRFTLNKYRIAIHFWPYRYRSLPYVSSSQFSHKIWKKISIIGFEIAPKIGLFSEPEALKIKEKRTLWYNSWHELHKCWLCLTAYRRLSSLGRCLFCTADINGRHKILFMDSLHIFYPPFQVISHFKYRRFIVKTCKYLFVSQIRPTGNSYFRFQKRWRTDNHELL